MVGGANTSGVYYSNVYEYDPVANTWTQKANFPEDGVGGTEILVIDSMAYLASGIRNSNVHGVSSAYSYNPATDTWTPIANYPGPPSIGLGSFVINNLGYWGSGTDGSGDTYNAFYSYNPSTNIWTQVANFPGKGRNVDDSRFVLNGQGYIGAGGTPLNGNTANFYDLNDFYAYNPLSNTWQAAPGVPNIPRDAATILSFPSGAYIVGGYNHDEGVFLNDVWEFTSCPADTDTIYHMVNDTIRISVPDTVHHTINDTAYSSTSTTGTLYINVPVAGGTNTLQIFADSTGSHLYINNGNYTSMSGYAVKISNAASVDVFVSQINQQQFYIDLNTWTGPGTYVLYVINPQLQVVATRMILLE